MILCDHSLGPRMEHWIIHGEQMQARYVVYQEGEVTALDLRHYPPYSLIRLQFRRC